jgi:hypothetical protein
MPTLVVKSGSPVQRSHVSFPSADMVHESSPLAKPHARRRRSCRGWAGSPPLHTGQALARGLLLPVRPRVGAAVVRSLSTWNWSTPPASLLALRSTQPPSVRVFSVPLEAMAVTGKSKTGEAGRKALIARADARASQLAPIVAELRRGGITSWYGIAMELNKRGVPTASGRGIWDPGHIRRLLERLK